ncbi:hypothetical protein AB0F92_34150 [Kitasatospora aureofaciens]
MQATFCRIIRLGAEDRGQYALAANPVGDAATRGAGKNAVTSRKRR